MNNYDLLITKLDGFIRKYYANKLIKGVIVFMSCLLLFVLTVSVSEYYLYLPSWLRVIIAGIFVLGGLSALAVWIIVPIVKMGRLGKLISHEQAAAIIGRHFPEVNDKLLNILQLRQQNDSHVSKELIEASIDQKAKQLAPVPILSAIDLTANKKYLPYLLPILLICTTILIIAPNVYTDASDRLLNPTKHFEKPAPFSFVVKNAELKTTRNSDYTIHVSTEGEIVPLDVSLVIGDDIVPMVAKGTNQFQYTFRNVTEQVDFKFYSAGFYSGEYNLRVVQKPLLKSFNVTLDYPSYTGRKDERISSLSDLTVPAGTDVQWSFVTEHTDEVYIRIGNGEPAKLDRRSGKYSAYYRFLRDTSYTLILKNNKSGETDSLNYFVKVIPDEYPVLQVQEYRDSVSGKQILINGSAGDDYGISKVAFHYSILDENKNEIAIKNIPLKITPGALTVFQHYFDIQTLSLKPGQQLNYYIEAWDNDGVNGSKSTRSEVMSYSMYDKDQLDSVLNANAEQINAGLSNSSQRTRQLQNKYRDMQSKLLKSDNMDWEQQQSLQNLMKMQESLQNEMLAVKNRFEEQKRQSEQKQYSDDLKEKQENLEKQMENLLDKELQEQMKKLQELMSKLNKQEAVKTMQELEQQNKLFNMDMERMKEMMKRMEMQMRMEDMANKMNELAEKQLALKDKTDKGTESNESLDKQQKQLEKELNSAMENDMKKMDELNENLNRPQDMEEAKDLAEQAKKDMQNSSQQLQQNQKGGSSQSQSQAAQNLQQMSQSLMSAASGLSVPQLTKDIKAVRQILSNLIRLSFDQEKLMNDVGNVNLASQSYVALQREQKRLHDNSKMIRDSLFELSKNIEQLAVNVNRETTELEKNMRASVASMESRNIGDGAVRQQYVMTHTNNLALMLNEVLSNLMSMMSQAQKGKSGQCNNPGGMTPKPGAQGQPSPQLSDVITQQKNLGNAMQQMQNAMQRRQQQGNKPGEEGQPKSNSQNKKPGGEGEYGDAEQLARLARQQAELRRQLQELSSKLNSEGLGNAAKELREIQEEMDKNETQLVNKRLSSELFLRQQQILTRLLEAEKSIREQMQDDKRSSKSSEDVSRPLPPELENYMKNHKQLTEQYKTNQPTLKPYYRNMVENYYKLLGT